LKYLKVAAFLPLWPPQMRCVKRAHPSSGRLQLWLKETFRNSLQSLALSLGFLALGKPRLLENSFNNQARRNWAWKTR
jgi:hypothetical protein